MLSRIVQFLSLRKGKPYVCMNYRFEGDYIISQLKIKRTGNEGSKEKHQYRGDTCEQCGAALYVCRYTIAIPPELLSWAFLGTFIYSVPTVAPRRSDAIFEFLSFFSLSLSPVISWKIQQVAKHVAICKKYKFAKKKSDFVRSLKQI